MDIFTTMRSSNSYIYIYIYVCIMLIARVLCILFACSFKERGACYTLLMLPEEQRKKGVISASLGNHALALSYHGHKLNIPVTVVMPVVAPIMKIRACRQHGANVVVEGKDMGEAKRIAMKLSKEHNLIYING
jgi:threonine dehydratase